MRSSGRLRRTLALTACGGLASALAWLPAGPASASVLNEYAAEASAQADYTGTVSGADCTLTAGDNSVESTPTDFSAGSHTASVNLDATFTNSTDSSDTVRVTGHYKGTYAVTKKHGDLTSLSLGGRGTITVRHAIGNASLCAGAGSAGGFAQALFTEHKAGWFYLTRDTARSAASIFLMINDVTGEAVVLDLYEGDNSSSTSRTFLKPGTYLVEELFGGVQSGGGGILAKQARASLTSKLTATFHAAGSATGKTSGAGKKFVSFPGSVSCSHHSATLRWTSAAGHVAKGSFLVNGHQTASDSNPRAGHKIVLRHLSKTADTTITAKLSLSGGGQASATRAYAPCKG